MHINAILYPKLISHLRGKSRFYKKLKITIVFSYRVRGSVQHQLAQFLAKQKCLPDRSLFVNATWYMRDADICGSAHGVIGWMSRDNIAANVTTTLPDLTEDIMCRSILRLSISFADELEDHQALWRLKKADMSFRDLDCGNYMEKRKHVISLFQEHESLGFFEHNV